MLLQRRDARRVAPKKERPDRNSRSRPLPAAQFAGMTAQPVFPDEKLTGAFAPFYSLSSYVSSTRNYASVESGAGKDGNPAQSTTPLTRFTRRRLLNWRDAGQRSRPPPEIWQHRARGSDRRRPNRRLPAAGLHEARESSLPSDTPASGAHVGCSGTSTLTESRFCRAAATGDFG